MLLVALYTPVNHAQYAIREWMTGCHHRSARRTGTPPATPRKFDEQLSRRTMVYIYGGQSTEKEQFSGSPLLVDKFEQCGRKNWRNLKLVDGLHRRFILRTKHQGLALFATCECDYDLFG